MVVFNSYVRLPKGKSPLHQHLSPINHHAITIKLPFSYGYPMVFLCFFGLFNHHIAVQNVRASHVLVATYSVTFARSRDRRSQGPNGKRTWGYYGFIGCIGNIITWKYYEILWESWHTMHGIIFLGY